MEIPKRFKNNIGYFSFYTKKNKVKTFKIKIEHITSVFDDENNIGTFVKFKYFKTLIKFKIINFIFKTNFKEEKSYEIDSAFWSKDFFSFYQPYGFLDLNLIGKDVKESKIILSLKKIHNKDYSQNYRKFLH